YMVAPTVREALRVSIALTLLALFVFGFVKGRFTGARPVRSALQTVVIGGLAAAAAFGIARAIS
ncbi:MAG TPA: VIT1/CCC1 transporter family protein, partial [Gemmatimonadaceae bacterium]|nr:VIT1/CCC1 transporter family protein [Gemmatimonadaceae bacterium]